MSGAARLRELLAGGSVVVAPGVGDALGARLVEAAGHDAVFCSGFAVSGMRLGLPDTGLLGADEMIDQLDAITAITSLPVIADADTGYGNAVNAQRTMLRFARAGAACVMIEDQEWPKRCGHTAGKRVVSRAEAVARVRAAADVRSELGLDTLLMARTDARAVEGFDEARERCELFVDAGADLTFLEAPADRSEMERYCATVPGPKVANIVDDGITPWMAPDELGEIGYRVAIYPVSIMLHAVQAMADAAADLAAGRSGSDRVSFDEMRSIVGWPDYEARSDRYTDGRSADATAR